MDLLSLFAVLCFTLFFVFLCIAGMHANRKRSAYEESQKLPKLLIEQGYRSIRRK